MNKPNLIFKALLLLLVTSAVYGQPENKQPTVEPSYEVILQVVVGSNNPSGKTAIPQNLSNAVKKLRSLYGFSNYHLETTFLQRTSSTLEYKSVQSDFTKAETENPIFSEWAIKGLRKMPTAAGREVLMLDYFRFGARVPIALESSVENGEKSRKIIYDQIGISTYKFSLNENEPTIIGSLTTAKTDEMIFLVLTVQTVQ